MRHGERDKDWDRKWKERRMNKIILFHFTICDNTVTQF